MQYLKPIYITPPLFGHKIQIQLKDYLFCLFWLSDFHTYNTRWSNLSCIVVPSHNTKLYGRNSVNISAVYSWDYLDKLNENNLLINYYQRSLRSLLKIYFWIATTNSNMTDCNTCNILGFTQVTEYILNIVCAMNFSGTKFN